MTIQEARQRDRERRNQVNQDRRVILRSRPDNPQANLPYNELSNGMVVLDEASAEFAYRLWQIKSQKLGKPMRTISARGKL